MKKSEIARAGIDVGTTLAKIVVREASGKEFYSLIDSKDFQSMIPFLKNAEEINITGGGATLLSEHVDIPMTIIDEFGAWSTGANRLLGEKKPDSYLLVSLGTGTSAILVSGLDVKRVGGTALGGGTVLGLGAALLNVHDFNELCVLAGKGARYNVDLRVADIYPQGEIQLQGDLTASSFAKLARKSEKKAAPEDLVAAIMGVVGENVALICGGLASQYSVKKIVYAGTSLKNNPSLTGILLDVTRMLGKEPLFLNDGEFAGALGALHSY